MLVYKNYTDIQKNGQTCYYQVPNYDVYHVLEQFDTSPTQTQVKPDGDNVVEMLQEDFRIEHQSRINNEDEYRRFLLAAFRNTVTDEQIPMIAAELFQYVNSIVKKQRYGTFNNDKKVYFPMRKLWQYIKMFERENRVSHIKFNRVELHMSIQGYFSVIMLVNDGWQQLQYDPYSRSITLSKYVPDADDVQWDKDYSLTPKSTAYVSDMSMCVLPEMEFGSCYYTFVDKQDG